ncbi:glycosyltransferase family 4 protein [Agrobacterium sp. a22-2]|uniref:glycosyltransferase family 4 protein n=1 Tax=Agrobacterium sp. a22-2 TaxID=2283840 RepID=UPI001445B839|nr:glycosyltransferase family 4 protein [Agrobacterium sp. a22-2]NKN39205.1 glycosyltransferase family 4 protein [Agrobacterium sp. a22-2]
MKTVEMTLPDAALRTATPPLIVQVVRQYAPSQGGLEDVVANLSAHLLAKGFRVRIITCDRIFTDPSRRLPAFEMIGGVEVVRIPWAGSKRYPFAPSVFRYLADADLIHVHAVDFFFDALAWGRLLHGKPMVATTHGGFFHTTTYARIKRFWFQTVTRLSATGYKMLCCCSRPDLAMFERIAGDHAMLIENGVDILKFAGLSAAVPNKRIVTIGRFSVNKRIERLLDAMAVLVERDSAWHLDIVGSPSDFTVEDLAREIRTRNLLDHVSVHASPDNDRIRTLIGQASIFASASDYEGFGLVAVEAMSAGLVPVLHPNEAYRSLAAAHDGVALADFADPPAAAERIEAAYGALLLQPAETRQRLMDQAGGYAWDRVAQRYIDLYRAVLGGQPFAGSEAARR